MQINPMCEEFRGGYETLTVNGPADSNGNLSIAIIGSRKIYGAFFHPSADSYGVVVIPWVYPTYGGVIHLHAMEYTGAPAIGATLKGDLNIYYKTI